MSDENNVADISNTAEETTDLNPVEEVIDSTDSIEESIDDVKARLTETEQQLAQEQKARKDTEQRAEIAEKKVKAAKQEAKADLSSRDTIAIINAKVHEDDVDEVLDYAKY